MRLWADDQYSIAVEERVIPDQVGIGPLTDPGCVGLDGGTGDELAQGLAEEEVVVLGVVSTLCFLGLESR